MKDSSSNPSSPQKTSDSTIALAALRLQEKIVRQIEQNIFCATGPLEELAISAREVRRAAPSPEHRVLAFVLESVFRRLHYDQDGRQVEVSESTARQRLFLNPVTIAADCLAGKGGDALAIADVLVQAASETLPN